MKNRERICYGPEGTGTGGTAGGVEGAGNGTGEGVRPGVPGGLAAGSGATGAQGGAVPGGGGESGDANTRPDWLPEQFWNPETKGTRVKELAKAFCDNRALVSKGVEGYKTQYETDRAAEIAKVRPADPAGYQIALGKGFENVVLHEKPLADGSYDGTKTNFVLNPNDPTVAFWRKTAHDAGLSQEQFNEGIGAFVKSKMGDMPNPEAEMKTLGENGKARINAVNAYVKSTLTEASYKALESFATTAKGVVAIEELMAKNTQARLADASGEGASGNSNGGFTDATIGAAIADPRYRNPDKRDPAFVAQVEAYYTAKYAGVAMHGAKPSRA